MINSPQQDHPSWLQRGWQQAPWRTQTQGTSLVLAAVVLVAVIGALYLAQASRTAAAGRRLQQMEAERQRLEQQNAQLRAEIAALRSVPRLIGAAQSLGYHPARAEEVQYLVVHGVAQPTPQPIESRVQSPKSPSEDEDDVVAAYDETLESYLTEQLSGFREQWALFWGNTFNPDATPSPNAPTAEPGPTRIP